MSELFDKEVNAQKESLKKYFWGSHKPTKKCVMKIKETKKNNNVHVKMFLWKEDVYREPAV